MPSLPSSVPSSLTSAYAVNNAWLTQDTTNPTGKGPVSTGPVEPISDPANGTAPVDLGTPAFPFGEPELAETPPDHFAGCSFPHAGPWPELPETATGKEPFGTLVPDGIVPIGTYRIPPKVTGRAHTEILHPGHDAQAQVTDTAGWDQYLPSGRVAVLQGNHQDYPGVENFWPVTQPNMARARTARGANQSINGTVAQYGDLASSGGSEAYEPPAPPAVTTQAPAAGGSTIPRWGFPDA